jgi:hypothetical protein
MQASVASAGVAGDAAPEISSQTHVLPQCTSHRRAKVSEQPAAAAAAAADEGPLVNGLTLDERFQLCR